jgi:chitinase
VYGAVDLPGKGTASRSILLCMRSTQLLAFFLVAAGSIAAQSTPDRLLVGYWHNWSSPNTLPLTAIPDAYDVINISFATPTVSHGATMQFTPFASAYPTSQGFINDVASLQAAGKKVLISIGGANDPVVVDSAADAQAFASSMLQLITTYGFDGLDIDLEGSSFLLQAGDTDFRNPTTPRVVHFISGLNQLLSQLSSDFILSAAPETAMVQGGMSTYAGVWGSYLPVLDAFRNRFDWVHVQHYNTGTMYGRDGQIYTPGTVDFHVAMADALIGGFTLANGIAFSPFQPHQVAIGLPATTTAAGSGYTTPSLVHEALDRLILGKPSAGYQLANANGYPSFRGLMTWSINWDVLANNAFSQPHRDYLDSVFLHVDTAAISAVNGGTASFTLTAGRANANRTHLMLVGFTGTSPGTLLPGGAYLPLNIDALSSAALDPAFNSIFSGFSGVLDSSGEGTAQLIVPPIPPLVGLPLSFAYALAPWDFSSTSVDVMLTQ